MISQVYRSKRKALDRPLLALQVVETNTVMHRFLASLGLWCYQIVEGDAISQAMYKGRLLYRFAIIRPEYEAAVAPFLPPPPPPPPSPAPTSSLALGSSPLHVASTP
jgi:hypothetical protein